MRRFLISIVILCITGYAYSQTVIDTMDSTSGWTKNDHDGTSDVTLSAVSGLKGSALHIDYKMKNNTFIDIAKEYKYINLSGGDRIRIKYKPQGNRNTFKLIVTDSSDESYTWTWEAVKPTDHFQTWYCIKTASHINWAEIKFMKFEINNDNNISSNEGGSGSFLIGPVDLYQTSFVTESTTVVDDFDDTNDTTNNLGFENMIYESASGIKYLNSISNYLTLIYTNGGSCSEEAWVFKLETNQSGAGLNVAGKQSIRFKIKGKDGGEKIGIDLQDTSYNGSNPVILDEDFEYTITTSWQWVEIPLSTFSSADVTKLYELKILFSKNGMSSLGQSDITIYIDDIQFYTPVQTAGFKKNIDMMNLSPNRSAWNSAAGGKPADDPGLEAQLTVSRVDSEIGKVTKMDYTFNKGQWAVIERYFSLNMFEYGGLSFDFAGDNANNHLEVKLEDRDGTRYKKQLYKFTDTDNRWTKVKLDLTKDFLFEASGDNGNLNLKQIAKIYFAIVKKDGTDGNVTIDNIEIGDYVYNVQTKGGLITDFKISPNPFSPNEDGFEDTIDFIYSISKPSKITLYIYDLKGNQVKVIEPAGVVATGKDHEITWNGIDYAEKLTRNGLYIIKFYAKAIDGSDADVKSVISVLK